MYKVVQKLKHTKKALKRLNAEGYSEIRSKDTQAYQQMITCQEEMQKNPQNEAVRNEEYQVVMNYKSIHKQWNS